MTGRKKGGKLIKAKQNPFIISLVVLVIYMVALKFGEWIFFPDATSLDDLVTQRVNIVLLGAALLLLGTVIYFRWQRPVGLKQADPPRSWLLLWFPALIILAIVGLAAVLGLPPTPVILFVLINTLIVGVGEELMFRGILFYGVLSRFNIWPAILLTSLLFGLVHALNGFLTGDFTVSLLQALQAAMSGIWFQAIRLRTKSIYPAMLSHGLWDFVVFVLLLAATGVRGGAESGPATVPLMQQFMFAVLIPLPLFLYGLWLLRGIGKKEKKEVLA